MGLDMYLTGEKYLLDWSNPANNKHEDGYPLKATRFALGYWRKHPDLHGYIVNNFAESEDDCKPVFLSADNIAELIAAVRAGNLPKTTGFFFGESTNDDEQKAEDVEILSKALEWLRADEWHRSIYYQASW